MRDESPIEAVKRVLGHWFEIKDPSNVAVMALIEAVRDTSPPHREATFDTLRAILRSLRPTDGLESWAYNCAREITSFISHYEEVRKVAEAAGEGFWCSMEGMLTGMLLRATSGHLDLKPHIPSVQPDLSSWEKTDLLASLVRDNTRVHDIVVKEDGTLSIRLHDYKDAIEVKVG